MDWFYDQFTNLHAICDQIIENNEESCEIQMVSNILHQDLIDIENAEQIYKSNGLYPRILSTAKKLIDISFKKLQSLQHYEILMDKVNGPTQTSFPTTYSPKNEGFEFDDKADDFERMLEDSNLFDEDNQI